MILVIESVVLCLAFTGMVYLMSRDPIKTLYNYPPKIQARVKSLPEYQGKIPTQKNKVAAKLCASVLFVIVLALVLRYVNGCTTFMKAFGMFFFFSRFVLPGTEDMTADYHDYGFHLKGFCIGEALALVVCALAGLVVRFVL